MSSVGQALGGLVGGAIGFFLGGPVGALRGAQIGIMAGGLIDPPDGPVINGPRLDDLSVQTSTYGAFIPRNYGTIAQTGNVFWVQGDSLIEVETTTESGGKGGPTQTTNTWSYYATFAVGLCQGPIDGVRRIWIGGQLWYDAGSDDVDTIIVSNEKADLFSVYLGTDTQTADPLIQADKGIANVPAYRGLAYIVFDTLPLENYGNSLAGAQVKVEIVKNGSAADAFITLGSASTSVGPYAVEADGIFAYVANNNAATLQIFNIADPNTPLLIGSASTSGNPLSLAVSGKYAYVVSGVGITLQIFDISDLNHPTSVGSVDVSGSGHSAISVDGNRAWITDQSNNVLLEFDVSDRTTPTLVKSVSTGTSPRDVEFYNEYLHVVNYTSNSLQIFDAASLSLVGSVSTTGNPVSLVINDGTAFVVGYIGNSLQLFDVSNPVSPSALGSATTGSQPISVTASGNYAYTVSYNGGTLQAFDVSDTASPTVAASVSTGSTPAHVHIADALVCVINRTVDTLELYLFNGDKITPATTILGDIVEAECLTSNLLTAGDLDVTTLTDTVRGYRVTQLGAIRGALDPLRAAWPFDVVQHGYDIKFVRRGTASVATIPSEDLDARQAGEAPGVQITDTREMDIMLPRRVSLNYVDVTREYETNQQYAERINTDAINERLVELPIVFNADEAAKKAETLLYMYWMERYDVVFRLPSAYSELEPGDVITITATDATYELRLTSVSTLPDGRLECQAKYNQAALYTPTAEGEEGQSTGNLLTRSGPSVYALLDIPLMLDDNDTAGFPVAMSGYLTGWPGGILYRSDDAGGTWTDLKAFPPGCVMGYATNSLSTHGGTLYDFAGTLTVILYAGTLASVTEAQLFAGSNWFAYGADGRWEIIAARTATLQGDGSYILTDFLRGQHGTEWATGLHAANDRIVLLDQSALAFISVNASSIGVSSDYRGITVGQSLDSDPSLSFSYDGVNLECLSPINLKGDINPGTNQWTLYWTRRSRFVEWRDYVDARLGESSESYEVDIYADGTYATVKRTLTSATETVNYSSAHQVTDFGGNQTTLYVKVYQLSATVGRGYPLTASISR